MQVHLARGWHTAAGRKAEQSRVREAAISVPTPQAVPHCKLNFWGVGSLQPCPTHLPRCDSVSGTTSPELSEADRERRTFSYVNEEQADCSSPLRRSLE